MATHGKNQVFAREFARLNQAQKEAVEHIEGPVMVVAGPGTGKTQTVALRIANILTKTQLNPRNILALTFTEAGVTALRQRLETIIGVDAYQVTIATFHSFANEVIGTFPYVFGFAVEAMQVSDLERLELLHHLVSRNTKLTALRPARTPTFHVATIAEAIRKVKQENVSPERLRELADQELADRLKAAKITAAQKQTIERTHQLNQELADVYQQYQALLGERHLYDYEDMILFAVDGLKNEADVKAYYQERYQYILVDEYQDTNNAQNALVEALADFFDRPNLFVVGDDKQAIYRFQGASVANMLHFAQKFPELKIITLAKNYRSVPQVIAAASTLIGYNQHQLQRYLPELSPQLDATRPANNQSLKLTSYPVADAEFAAIVAQLRSRAASGVAWEDMAVLFRRNQEVRSFRDFALKNGLELSGVESTSLVTEPEVQRALTLLRAVDDPSDERLTALALGLIAPISPVTLARLGRALVDQHTLERALVSLDLPVAEAKSINLAATQLNEWARQQSALPLPELVERVMSKSRLLSEASSQPDALERLELLKVLMNEVKKFAIQHPASSLKSFLDYIELLRDYRVRLKVNRLTPELGGVFVSTVHGAKGLEFDTVFLGNVSAEIWNDRVKRELIKLPPGITNLKIGDESAVEEERRLFYVALTRAKNFVVASYPRANDDGKELIPCQFMQEIIKDFESSDVLLAAPEAKAILQTALSPISAITMHGQQQRLIRELVSNRPFSYTDYKTFRLCPQQYLLKSVLKFPTKVEPRLVYGSILHRALELFYKQYRFRKKLPTLEALHTYLDQAARQSENFSGKQAVIEQARRLLTAYHQQLEPEPPLPVGVEYSFTDHHVMLEDVWITGKFDRVDPIDATARTVKIVDYKTGSQAQTRNSIEGKTKAAEATGALRDQLVFYSMLAGADRHFPFVAHQFALKFLDDKHTFREEVFTVGAAERDALAADVIKAHQEILSLEKFSHSRDQFDRGCEICEMFSLLA